MSDIIIDSKYRTTESLPSVGGRQRFLASDLISGRLAVLEYAPIDHFESELSRWWEHWQPSLRERVARFAQLESVVPVVAVGVWQEGIYYVYELDDQAALRGEAPQELPNLESVQQLLLDLATANELGDHVLNMRPEQILVTEGRLLLLPGSYVLPLEVLVRSGARSPYQPPELRHAGHIGPTTDGYTVSAVLGAMAERIAGPAPEWLARMARMQVLEPERRPTPCEMARELLHPTETSARPELLRRSVERLADLRPDETARGRLRARVLEALDSSVNALGDRQSTVLVLEGPASGAGLKELFLDLHEVLCFLTERPRVFWIDALTSWEARDLGGTERGLVVLVPDYRPAETELLPLQELLAKDKLRPALWVVGVRRDVEIPSAEARTGSDVYSDLATHAGPETPVRKIVLEDLETEPFATPSSPAARHLLDLLSVFEADATADLLRMALPHQEADMPAAVAELERLGHLRRLLEGGGWWGREQRLTLRTLRPDVLEAHRRSLPVERREELHLLVSHLLGNIQTDTLGRRYLCFHHLFAGGKWDAAASECVPLLKWVQKRGLGPLTLQIQRKLANSNLAPHFSPQSLLDALRSLGTWETEQGRLAEGQSYFERAAERLFALDDKEAGRLELAGVSEMVLSHADLLERRGDVERALELLQHYLDRFDERLTAHERGRLFSEMAYCEYRLGRSVAAEERSQVALKLLDSRSHLQDVAQVYSVLGLVRWKASRYEEAEQYFTSSVALREKSGDKLAMARSYNNLGLLYRSMRRFPDALEYHRKSMEIRQELGDQEGVAKNVLNLAWLHFEMANFEHAEELALRACDLSQKLGALLLRVQGKSLLGEIYLARERMPEAREALADAVLHARQVGDVSELFMVLRKQASLELRCGHLERAEELLKEAEESMSHAASPLEEAHWNEIYGELKREQGDTRGAARAFENAGNNQARLGHSYRAAEMFLLATGLYRDSGLMSRARDLVVRARQLFGSDRSGVVPQELMDLEAALGTSEAQPGIPQVERLLESLCRVASTAATASAAPQAIDQIISEMRGVSGARCVLLVDRHGDPARVSTSPGDPEAEPQARGFLADNPRLVSRALQTLLPFGLEELGQDKPKRPFYLIPVEVHERSLGCVFLHWSEDALVPEEGVLQVLRVLSQHVALVLKRFELPSRLVATGGEAFVKPVNVAPRDESGLDMIVGRSAARQAHVDFVRQVRDLEATVLVMGENGTGKEVVSRAIHYTGNRRQYAFVTINCTAIPEALWERELFGHERGAFTDAFEAKRGHFEAAHRGTLLLDEIGDMPWAMQTKFLRVLEDKSFSRIGGTERVHVDVRLIAATNHDLVAAVDKGRFRRDLYHRLNVLSVILPPLRDRREDIPELARYFLDLHATSLGVRPKRLSGEALRVLMRYAWPGNVRELENAMKGSLVLSDRDVLVVEDLPAAVLRGAQGQESMGDLDLDSVAKWVLDHAAYGPGAPLMPAMEKALARQLVKKIGEKTMAAKLLGISKPTLYTRLRD